MRVAIYGSHGYLATSLKVHLSNFLCLERSDEPIPGYFHIDFSFPSPRIGESEFDEYLQLIAKRSGLCKESNSPYLYIGSFSSLEPVVSKYGSRKKMTEKLVNTNGGSIIRLGLVTNELIPGGRHKQLINAIKFLPIVPILDSSTFQLFITNENNAIKSILSVLDSNEGQFDRAAEATFESNLGSLLERHAVNKEKKIIHVGKRVSSIVENMVRHSHFQFLDSLRSITVKRQFNLTNPLESGLEEQ